MFVGGITFCTSRKCWSMRTRFICGSYINMTIFLWLTLWLWGVHLPLALLGGLLQWLLQLLLLFFSALSSASLTVKAFFRSCSRRRSFALVFSFTFSIPCKSNISIPYSLTSSLDFLSLVSKEGVKSSAQSKYQAPPFKWEVVHVRCWRAENMQVEFDLSSHVVKNTGKSSLDIAPLGSSSYLKYLSWKITHNITLKKPQTSKSHNLK